MTTPPPKRGRTRRQTPRELYPDWPNDTTAEGAHGIVQDFVSNLATFVESATAAGTSQAELCRQAGVVKSVLTKVLQGDVWPDSVTVAKFETVARRRLWTGPRPE
ncbi:hypothetical protein [Corynebacterium cystitidis]|uniref:Helix-turn-helix n=1 Tax=Corynebacterium cystitidis DSM 20524 TaxID=1121357 RepID=A0A1H9WN47_9CORY|nr:hypothetical protein [Corynebacterium cystitidis]WJY82833.1 hypothetical protein CCYS_09595 [Corynebacterium cystitidis DSM 20524]SES35117.1 hypothetical protein SAMN05661109_02818 [Corynebacterium cystitidis DSM 20524]SNV70025.1 Uncharacterised protein [Corynebacterium cystitidis]